MHTNQPLAVDVHFANNI